MAENTNVPTVTLQAGSASIEMPQLGFGVWQVENDGASAAVQEALKVGYRSIDTARIYDNEEGVGHGIAASDVPRSDIFLTTKVWNDDQGADSTKKAFDASIERLGGESILPLDLYLIHWPTPEKDTYVDTFKAMLELRDAGKIRAVGVCNFEPEHLQRLKDETGEFPAINQVELHPKFQQKAVRDFCADNGIVVEAWSPLGQGGDILTNPVLEGIAERVGKTVAQVIIRWHLQIGNVVIPKSVTPARIAENFDVLDFELTEDDLHAISDLDDKDGRIGSHPNDLN
ncbi:aldo/keto reductase [Dermacoccus nishinomiyaensis]|uniref:aldo/keto reductase n=1 Tax=Dermacoccus nishinomiyaensis TaxID=1274 RepID=UPI000DF9E158|nr:aldo/keto reductase [Dermacoccus nishinomiyaensis]QQY24172.1 aldo/keto reductase [Dermacoccus nishinomiyaensis]STD71226.1 Uncharacterized oxidoreductase MSMEG_2408 [Dermacoccus nishinomiyaensis]